MTLQLVRKFQQLRLQTLDVEVSNMKAAVRCPLPAAAAPPTARAAPLRPPTSTTPRYIEDQVAPSALAQHRPMVYTIFSCLEFFFGDKPKNVDDRVSNFGDRVSRFGDAFN